MAAAVAIRRCLFCSRGNPSKRCRKEALKGSRYCSLRHREAAIKQSLPSARRRLASRRRQRYSRSLNRARLELVRLLPPCPERKLLSAGVRSKLTEKMVHIQWAREIVDKLELFKLSPAERRQIFMRCEEMLQEIEQQELETEASGRNTRRNFRKAGGRRSENGK